MAFSDSPTPQRRMRPDEVLAVLAGMLPEKPEGDEVCRDPVAHFDVTVLEWQDELDPLSDFNWRRLGRTLNRYFRISVSNREWKAVLSPAHSKSLHRVCELIASRAVVSEIRPVTVFGKPCLSAGAFLAVRGMLSRVGVDVANLRPSTRLEPLLKRHHDLFEQEIHKLAPGRLPPVVTRDHVLVRMFYHLMALGLLMLLAVPIGLGLWLAAAFLPRLAPILVPPAVWLVFGLAGVVPIVLGAVGAYATSSLPPSEVKLGQLETIRDLCLAIIGEDGNSHTRENLR